MMISLWFMRIKNNQIFCCHIKLKSDLNRLIFHDFEWYILLKTWFRKRYYAIEKADFEWDISLKTSDED